MLPILASLLGPLLGKIVDTVGSKIGVDMSSDELKTKKLEIELELQKMVAEQEKAVQAANIKQIEVNIQEAQHGNLFVAGWRPFIGWICGGAMAYHFIIQPLLVFLIATAGTTVDLPSFDMQSLLTVLMGMLGLGAMRTYEKVYGVSREAMRPAAPVKPKGQLVDDPTAGGLVWRE